MCSISLLQQWFVPRPKLYLNIVAKFIADSQDPRQGLKIRYLFHWCYWTWEETLGPLSQIRLTQGIGWYHKTNPLPLYNIPDLLLQSEQLVATKCLCWAARLLATRQYLLYREIRVAYGWEIVMLCCILSLYKYTYLSLFDKMSSLMPFPWNDDLGRTAWLQPLARGATGLTVCGRLSLSTRNESTRLIQSKTRSPSCWPTD